jgi:hypothetical protein
MDNPVMNKLSELTAQVPARRRILEVATMTINEIASFYTPIADHIKISGVCSNINSRYLAA